MASEDIRSKDLNLIVEEATAKSITLRLEGSALLATSADAAKADRGFDVRLLGHIKYDTDREGHRPSLTSSRSATIGDRGRIRVAHAPAGSRSVSRSN